MFLALGSIAVASLALGSLPVPAADMPPAGAAGPMGDLWEVSTKMAMEGMPMEMPGQTMKVCAAKEWKEPPAPADDQRKCKSTDFKLVGQKATWKMHCEGPPVSDGEGEITRSGADAYTGQIRITSEGGSMTMKLSGKRIGPCELPKK
jgi:hypothetical protein